MKSRIVVACAAALGLCAGASAVGIHNEAGDAGKFPNEAQPTNGMGELNLINGVLSSYSDVDMYCIYIKDPKKFSATTASEFDPQLFLFKTSGVGVVGDDDSAPGPNGLQAYIDGRFVGGAGTYLLAISVFNNEPWDSGGNNLFPEFTTYTNPATDGDPLFIWSADDRASGVLGGYQIRMTGVEFANCVVPLPTAGLMGLAGLGAAGMIRRRND
jgi:hypothetical protein